MKNYKTLLVIAGVLVALALTASPALAAKKKYKLERRIRLSSEYFEVVMQEPGGGIPSYILGNARGIIILRQYKIGLGIGIKGGSGIVMIRKGNTHSWSPPAFLKTGEGSIGIQAGGQIMDTVYLLMDDEGMSLLSKPKFRIGIDAAAAAGSHDVGAEAKLSSGTPILVYNNSAGLYAGAAFEGGFLLPDNKANATYYGNPDITMHEILFTNEVTFPDSAKALVAAIKKYSTR